MVSCIVKTINSNVPLCHVIGNVPGIVDTGRVFKSIQERFSFFEIEARQNLPLARRWKVVAVVIGIIAVVAAVAYFIFRYFHFLTNLA